MSLKSPDVRRGSRRRRHASAPIPPRDELAVGQVSVFKKLVVGIWIRSAVRRSCPWHDALFAADLIVNGVSSALGSLGKQYSSCNTQIV